MKVCSRTAIGFIVMGFIGFFVKLLFIPINQVRSSAPGAQRGPEA
jgi:protein transport protein SEC61 subunit gamma-like protein